MEWPLGNGVAEADELAKLAKAKGVKNIVGLQTRRVPAILKVRSLPCFFFSLADAHIDQGARRFWCFRTNHFHHFASYQHLHGQSSRTVRLHCGCAERCVTPISCCLCRSDLCTTLGVNILTVSGGHNLDSLTYVLGEFKSLSATTHQLYTLKLVNAAGEGRAVESTSPDSFSISGTLESGAAVSVSLTSVAGGKTNPESATWIIHGEKGALKLEAPNLMLAFPPQKLSLYKDGAWEEIETEAINAVGSIYETFANAGPGGEGLVSFEQAVVRHRLVEAIIKSARDGTRESYKTTY